MEWKRRTYKKLAVVWRGDKWVSLALGTELLPSQVTACGGFSEAAGRKSDWLGRSALDLDELASEAPNGEAQQDIRDTADNFRALAFKYSRWCLELKYQGL